MKRWFYVLLLKLHPKPFRDRFGEEMLAIFDESKDLYVRDTLGSLAHQWLLRPEMGSFCQTASSDGVPVFYSAQPEIPSGPALLRGTLVASCLFALLSIFMTYRWHQANWIVGSHHPSPSHILGAHTDAIAETDLPAEVKVRPYPDHLPIPPYFRLILVLSALDTDHDGVISATEIDNAPAALRMLDKDHNGKLTAEECGLKLAPDVDAVMRVRTRQMFMSVHPVLAALDADHDGVISAAEIRNAARALRSLDLNHDGRLTEQELAPDRNVLMAANIMLAVDLDGDGKISPWERIGPVAGRFQALLDKAQGKKGFVTQQDLVDALGK